MSEPRSLLEWIDWLHEMHLEQEALAESMVAGLLAVEQATLAALGKERNAMLPLAPPTGAEDSITCIVGPYAVVIMGGAKRPNLSFERIPILPKDAPCEPPPQQPLPF